MRKLTVLMLSLALSLGQLLAQQSKTITGKVTDDKGNPIPNASITVKGFKGGTTAGQDGTFSIEAASTAKTLVVSAVGYVNEQVSIINTNSVNVILKLDIKTEDDVVIIGYGKQKRKTQVGSTSIIGSKTFDQAPLASFDNAIQGGSAGVQVTAVNGKPGSVGFARIRGVGSLNAGQSPLVVIDGVPSVPSVSTAGVPTDNLNALNPNDIESVTILKDAASASIYGSRASNGVILVTTKKGKGRPQLTYRFQYGQITKTPDFNFQMMNASQKLQYEYDLGYENEYITQEIADRGLTGDLFTISATDRQSIWNKLIKQQNDWQNLVLRTAQLSSHEISLSGASDRIRYYFSTNFYKEEGIGLGSDFNRTTARLNVEYQAKDWVKIGTNSSASYVKENVLRDRFNVQSPFVAMYFYNPYENPKNPDGTWNSTHQGLNILEAIENNPEKSQRVNGLTSVYGELSFLKHLTIRSELGLNFFNFKRTYFVKPGSILDQITGDPAARGNKTDNGNWDVTRSWVNTANWTQTFNNNHNISILIGSEYNDNRLSTYSLSSKGFPTGNFDEQINGSTPTAASTTVSEWSLFSGFGRATYNYKETYFAEASIRRDGSSRFGIKSRYGNFWSFGAGWNIGKESFFEVKQINTLKLRTSFGTSGNFNIGNYQSLGLYGFTSYNGQPASRPIQIANPNLTWENNFNFDIGLDFEAFDSRLTATIEYYNRKTFDLLYDVPKSFTTGFQSRLENVGEMVNKGVEFTLGYDIIRNNNLKWNITGNLTLNKNKITKLYSGVDEIAANPNSYTKIKVGEPINVYFENRWVGVDPSNGKPQYLDKNGKIVNDYNPSDAVILSGKSPDPKYYGSINNTITYKNFSLSALIYFSGGNYIQNDVYQNLNSDGESIDLNQTVSALDYWKKPGDITENPNPAMVNGGSGTYSSYTTDRFLQKGDFIRLRNITLSYNLPSNIFGKFKIQGIRVYVQGQNLATITKFKGDPEVGIGTGENTYNRNGEFARFSYPQTRRVTFGIDVNF